MRSLLFVAVCIAAVAGAAHAQVPAAEWLFDDSTAGWTSVDPQGQLTSTRDENVTREGGEGVLEYSYTPAVGGMNAIAGPAPEGLAGGKSIHGWFQSTDPALLLVGLTEGDGSQYMTVFYSIPDRWQEVAIDISEFALSDDSEDENGQLDADQVQAVMIADGISFLAGAADQAPFILGPELTPRMLWVDDLSVETNGVEPRWAAFDEDGRAGVRFESFEGAPLQWATLAGQRVEITYDREYTLDGEFSLRVAYDLPAGKILGAITSLWGVPLDGMQTMRLGLMSEGATTLLLEIKEQDGSKYNASIQLPAGEQLENFELTLADFVLGDDSTDENGTLDMDQAKDLLIADVSAMVNAAPIINALWIDDVQFVQ